jgi:hypothetical protein
MKNNDIAFRIIITFIESFIGSFVVLMPNSNFTDKVVIQSIIISCIGSGISAVINYIKSILDENKSLKSNAILVNTDTKVNIQNNEDTTTQSKNLVEEFLNSKGD